VAAGGVRVSRPPTVAACHGPFADRTQRYLEGRRAPFVSNKIAATAAHAIIYNPE